MKPTAFLVNPAGDPLVDQRALSAARSSGALPGAGLDVFSEEPPDFAALTDVPNLVTSAHIGGLSRERQRTLSTTDSMLAIFAGHIPETVISPEPHLRWRSQSGTPGYAGLRGSKADACFRPYYE
jgi:D-3-phosphoglycerate dehydrogenase / 2-oxoglutarate reductase